MSKQASGTRPLYRANDMNARRDFMYAYVEGAGRETGLQNLEAFTGRDTTTGETLFPDAQARQFRLARLAVNLIVEASVQQALTHGVSIGTLVREGLVRVPAGSTLDEMQRLCDSAETQPRTMTNWLASHGAFVRVEDTPSVAERERDYATAMRKYRKTLNNPEHPIVPPPPPLWTEILSNPYVEQYFQLVVPDHKSQTTALESRRRRSLDDRINTSEDLDDIKYMAVGKIPDINRISVLPASPKLGDLFFERLNFLNRIDEHNPESGKDREDFFRVEMKMNANGYEDQKNYVALTEGVTEAATQRGIYGTIAEVACLSPKMYQYGKTTHTIYELQRKLEVKHENEARFSAERVSEDTLSLINRELKQLHEDFKSRLSLAAAKAPAARDAVADLLPSETPLKGYFTALADNADPQVISRAREDGLKEARRRLSTLQRGYHALAAYESSPEWRESWLKHAMEYNKKTLSTPEEQRAAPPMETAFLELVAGKEFSLDKMARSLKSTRAQCVLG